MAEIYIVNIATVESSTALRSLYLRTEAEGRASFDACMASEGEDCTLIELVCLDTETLETTVLELWDGTVNDSDDDDDWIVEGGP